MYFSVVELFCSSKWLSWLGVKFVFSSLRLIVFFVYIRIRKCERCSYLEEKREDVLG